MCAGRSPYGHPVPGIRAPGHPPLGEDIDDARLQRTADRLQGGRVVATVNTLDSSVNPGPGLDCLPLGWPKPGRGCSPWSTGFVRLAAGGLRQPADELGTLGSGSELSDLVEHRLPRPCPDLATRRRLPRRARLLAYQRRHMDIHGQYTLPCPTSGGTHRALRRAIVWVAGPAGSPSPTGQGQLGVTARFVTVVSGMATGSCAPATVRRRVPPSADFRMPQTYRRGG